MKARWPLLLVGVLTLIAFALRLHQYGGSLLGDEMSTLWVVRNNGLFDTVRVVNSDAEITPPLYFLLAWFTTRLGSNPDLVRLPALIAGTAGIPLVYVLGLRTVGRVPGLIAAALMTLSPFMIFFAGTGRAYALMITLLIASTLSMLAAVRGGRNLWWVAYALFSCLAMYSHYTALFVLLAQFIWLLWAEPGVRKQALIANVGAALLFLPWVPSFFRDSDSPTTDLLASLQGDGFETKRLAVEQWAFGHPLLDPSQVPGRAAVVAVVLALAVAAVASLVRTCREKVEVRVWLGEHKMVILVIALALATPVAEALYGLTGTDLFGSRNLAASTPGLLLAIGAVLTAAGPVCGGVCGVVVFGAFLVGTVKTLEDSSAKPDYKAAAERIDQVRETNDPVVDLITAPITPVPLTPLGSYLDDDAQVFSLNQPAGEPPFLPLTPIPDQDLFLNKALAAGETGRVFIVGPRAEVTVGKSGDGKYLEGGNIELPKDWRVDSVESYPGLADLNVYEISRTPDYQSADSVGAEAEAEDQLDHPQAEEEGGSEVSGDR
ncbi:MAG: glycosyltransferase family 39 protein [Thermoleophilia bacterium]|nr:glycosyltransferase family 39 protein [Thermoleophilia bacterium]